ncbi:hypothetical protein TruAng_009652 [Truncatella angustata]|nr:hypothetical protein TruAng_009652 [Truncatella angustata]
MGKMGKMAHQDRPALRADRALEEIPGNLAGTVSQDEMDNQGEMDSQDEMGSRDETEGQVRLVQTDSQVEMVDPEIEA